ncbi:RNA polymerase sigma factor [Umezawaea tangerina]|uniref:RNA polymerase sigma-70 factor (ECF subfamily) n=1 Tax=Umezawaea tangerina TaxID=84725 RepID=A0A2T0SG75_9PSEU|nr:RNA polymerase sigma factor [Umezawaea tangerina]PRY32407.1 RNA polymerase sigma-70 factor (ECF subfamily) [Umezawaea tangerina]
MTGLDALVAAAAGGDAAAMNALLDRVRPVVLRTCARFLEVPEDVEDAAQEALLRISETLSARPSGESFRGWMYVVVVNVARQRFRVVHRGGVAGAVPGDLVDPRRTSVVAGSRLDLLSALERLHVRQPRLAEALVYRDVCKLGYGEIADVLGVPVSTVKSRIHDARRCMRGELDG